MDGQEAPKTIIAEDIEIQGTIKSASNIQLDGKLNGDLTCGGNAVIGANANIKGNISVESISLLGTVNGNITAKDRIELKSSARLTGDIRAKRLTVEDGVTFVGKSEVNPSGGPRTANQPEPAAQEPEAEVEAEVASDEGKGRGNLFGKK